VAFFCWVWALFCCAWALFVRVLAIFIRACVLARVSVSVWARVWARVRISKGVGFSRTAVLP